MREWTHAEHASAVATEAVRMADAPRERDLSAVEGDAGLLGWWRELSGI